jgi:hypothetical protein
MKIHPPRTAIDQNDPFKEALFGRKAFAASLTQLLHNVSESLVVFVHAPWGEGKTTFAQMWRADLARQKLEVVYFDAYATDYLDDPFISFCGEVLALTEKKFSDGKGFLARQDFQKSAVEVGKRLAGLAVKVGLKAATLGALEETHLKELKDIGSEIATGVAKIGSETIEKRIAHYAEEKESLASFKTNLTKLAAIIREEQDFPLTIIVDELDRCRPDFALALLERIKHLFDVEGVAFVLLVNQDQIESYIKTVYGEVDARAYLLKFANVFVNLPRRKSEDGMVYEPGRSDYCRTLAAHHELTKLRDSHFLTSCVAVFVEHFDLTLREIEKVFTILALFYSTQNSADAVVFLVAMLSVLKVKNFPLYAQLCVGSISLKDFSADTRLDQLKSSSQDLDSDWARKLLSFCLMPEDEYQKAVSAEEKPKGMQVPLSRFENHFRAPRNRIIPTLCSRLDRFSLKP